MKKIYWRPRGVSRIVLALIAVLAVGGLVAVERFQIHVTQSYYAEKLAAARLADEAFDLLKTERLGKLPEIDPETDPTISGLIGAAMTPATSDPGTLSAKQTSINPNWAAVIVQMLKKAGVKRQDYVAVGCSGSFPALNISVYAAIETLKLRPVIISSAAASQWGANLPDFLWTDMEQILYEYHKFDFRSVAASIGGVEDRGLGIAPEGRKLLAAAIERAKLPMINPKSFEDSINRRMEIYTQQARGAPIKAYINVGGGTTSVGTVIGKRMFEPGLNLHTPTGATTLDSVMTRFSKEGVPVIHLTQIEHLAQAYGLPVQPTKMPEVGEGKVFFREEYNVWLAIGVLAAIIIALYAFIRSELGYRIFQVPRSTKEVSHEPMI